MRKIAVPCLLALLAACGLTNHTETAGDPRVEVMSFNIRYGTADDGPDAWPRRETLVYDLIRTQDADFIGLQEALRFQIDGIREAVPGYAEIGAGRRDGREAGEYSAILYKADRWHPAEHGTFWLSDTPAVPGSTSWGNAIPRIVTWGRFVATQTGRTLWVFNTHFDHESQPSRMRSATLLASRIASRGSDAPVVVTGDFNAGEDNPAIRYLTIGEGGAPVTLVDAFRVLHPDALPAGTFNGFEGRRDGPKLDYVLVEPGIPVHRAGILRDDHGGRYPSDHFPVYAEISLPAR